MLKNWAEWASGHCQPTKIGLSGRLRRTSIPTAAQFWYRRHEFEVYLGNVGSRTRGRWRKIYDGLLTSSASRQPREGVRVELTEYGGHDLVSARVGETACQCCDKTLHISFISRHVVQSVYFNHTSQSPTHKGAVFCVVLNGRSEP